MSQISTSKYPLKLYKVLFYAEMAGYNVVDLFYKILKSEYVVDFKHCVRISGDELYMWIIHLATKEGYEFTMAKYANTLLMYCMLSMIFGIPVATIQEELPVDTVKEKLIYHYYDMYDAVLDNYFQHYGDEVLRLYRKHTNPQPYPWKRDYVFYTDYIACWLRWYKIPIPIY